MISLAEFLLNTKSEYNQHKTTEIKQLPLETALELCREMEGIVGDRFSFICEVWSDGSYSIIQKDFFSEHALGHKDRIILSVDSL